MDFGDTPRLTRKLRGGYNGFTTAGVLADRRPNARSGLVRGTAYSGDCGQTDGRMWRRPRIKGRWNYVSDLTG